MNGIVGMLHLDERPVDQKLLQQMTAAVALRVPTREFGLW
jgi:hypothetical protein